MLAFAIFELLFFIMENSFEIDVVIKPLSYTGHALATQRSMKRDNRGDRGQVLPIGGGSAEVTRKFCFLIKKGLKRISKGVVKSNGSFRVKIRL